MAGNRPTGLRCTTALALAVACVATAGCGGSANNTATRASTSTTATATASTPPTSTSATGPAGSGTTPASGTVPAGAVAVAAGRPITRAAFDHWLDVAAGQPPIVPGDPPAFKRCIAQVRKAQPSLAKQSSQQLRAGCNQLFTALSAQVMTFLITSDWYEADAGRLKLLPSSAEVASAYNTQKRQAFPTESGFRSFLAKTGQTAQDVRFRVLVNEAGQQLLAREHGTRPRAARL